MEDRFKIILITPERELTGEALLITRLLAAGADCVHLRKPGLPKGYIDKILSEIPRDYMSRIKLHDHYDLAVKYGTGVQLNSRNTDIPCTIKKVAKSCHTIAEASQCTASFEYVTLSPVFDSISKTGYKSVPSLISSDITRLPVKTVSLGGVTIDALEQLKKLGFAGAALLGAVWDTEGGYDAMISYLRRRNSQLQFITDGMTTEQTIFQSRSAISGGCRWIQIRMKESPVEAIKETAIELIPECRRQGVTLIINDNIELTAETGADGVHVGQKDRSPEYARDILGNGPIIGLTVNTIEQLQDAITQPADYFGIGPFRFTTTKKRLAPTLGTDGYRKFVAAMQRMNCNRPFVAIGGITTDDIGELAGAGVTGIAISGAIAHADNPEAATRQFIKTINQHIKTI